MSKFERVLSRNELLDIYRSLDNPKRDRDSVIEAMGAAADAYAKKLAEQQEPMAWVILDSDGVPQDVEPFYHGDTLSMESKFKKPLYTHPMPNNQGLLDSSITPLAQRKIQSLLDKGEYRVVENATVLVNENGHAAIVNHGGAFYWVDNDGLAREFDAAEYESKGEGK